MLGKGYVIEHCVSFFHNEQKNALLIGYITDALKAIVYNTGKHNDFIEIKKSYNEIKQELSSKNMQEEKTSDEIIGDIRDKISHIFSI